MDEALWYTELIRPSWAPPSWVFGPVWTVLYAVIFLSFGTVFVQVWRRKIPWNVAVPFIVNLVANALFTPLQFSLQSNLLAAIDILVVLGTILWAMQAVWKYARWIAYAQIPYLLWVSFATVLQLTITVLNWP